MINSIPGGASECSFTSRETLYRSRHIYLNAEGYNDDFSDGPVQPFITEEFDTHARSKENQLYFGLPRNSIIDDYELPARAVMRWRQREADNGPVLDVAYRWAIPQNRIFIGSQVATNDLPVLNFPVNGEFSEQVDGLRVESFRNKTHVTFGKWVAKGSGVQLVPAEIKWRSDALSIEAACGLLVVGHFDRFICKILEKVSERNIPLVSERQTVD